MSIFNKARGVLNRILRRPPPPASKPTQFTLPDPVVKPYRFGPPRRRSDKVGRGARARNGARLTARWPVNGVKP